MKLVPLSTSDCVWLFALSVVGKLDVSVGAPAAIDTVCVLEVPPLAFIASADMKHKRWCGVRSIYRLGGARNGDLRGDMLGNRWSMG